MDLWLKMKYLRLKMMDLMIKIPRIWKADAAVPRAVLALVPRAALAPRADLEAVLDPAPAGRLCVVERVTICMVARSLRNPRSAVKQ